MAEYEFRYGTGTTRFEYPEEDVLGVLTSHPVKPCADSPEGIVRLALENPIGTKRLREIVKAGEKVCIAVPDFTRMWQKPHIYTPLVVEELERAGVRDSDITIVIAAGSHRTPTPDEQRMLVSPNIFDRIRVVNHDCRDLDNLVGIGVTRRGTKVLLNRIAFESDRLVLTGGIVYHFLAGFGGGKKMVLPGLCGYETIMRNHSYSFLPGEGAGRNTDVRCGNMTESNPLHDDMLEAASFARVDFLLNVVCDSAMNMVGAVSGDLEQAHKAGAELVRSMDDVVIPHRARLVIACAGGSPKDINLYQTSKVIFNAVEAVEEGGAMIIVSECTEGLGSPDIAHLFSLKNQQARESDARAEYSIAKGISYDFCRYAGLLRFILVSSLPAEALEDTGIVPASSVNEAVALAKEYLKDEHPGCWIMPFGANTMPVVEEDKK